MDLHVSGCRDYDLNIFKKCLSFCLSVGLCVTQFFWPLYLKNSCTEFLKSYIVLDREINWCCLRLGIYRPRVVLLCCVFHNFCDSYIQRTDARKFIKLHIMSIFDIHRCFLNFNFDHSTRALLFFAWGRLPNRVHNQLKQFNERGWQYF